MLCDGYVADMELQDCSGEGTCQHETRKFPNGHCLVRPHIEITDGQRRTTAKARCTEELDEQATASRHCFWEEMINMAYFWIAGRNTVYAIYDRLWVVVPL
jgi:hypothetical protein